MLNTGDILFSFFLYLLFLFILVFAVFFGVRKVALRKTNNQKKLEYKLDRIIELLEKDKKD